MLAVILPLLFGVVADWFRPEDREELTVNLMDEPSVAPEVAPQTTRLPPAPTPEPEIADLPQPPPPEPEIANLPAPEPPKPKLPKAPPEPKFELPKVVKPKPAAPPPQDRKLTDSRKTGVRTGERKNPDIPIGKRDTGQRYGEKPSDTPQGGPRNDARYAAMLSVFLKARWNTYVPVRAQLGAARPEVEVWLRISGEGKLLDARITRPSGNAMMDGAVTRMLNDLRRQPMPVPGNRREQNIRVTFDTSG